jgi:CheY-like chemotaxis protein
MKPVKPPGMKEPPFSILLVEADDADRQRYGRWLEAAGYEVVACPGPQGPEYTCVGSRTGACPLTADVELIILDTRLEGELAMAGASAADLISVYRATGRPVVVLEPRIGRAPLPEPGVVRLAWPPDRSDLVLAARALTED